MSNIELLERGDSLFVILVKRCQKNKCTSTTEKIDETATVDILRLIIYETKEKKNRRNVC